MTNLLTTAITELVSTSVEKYLATDDDNIFNGIPLFNKLMESGKKKDINGGYQINDLITYAKNSSNAARNAIDEIPLTKQQIHDRVQYTWAEYTGSVLLDQDDIDKNQGGIIDIVESQITNEKRSIKDKIDTDLFATTVTAPSINALGVMISTTTTTGTVGGISRTNTWWRQNSQASAGSFQVNGRTYMKQTYNNCSKGQQFDTPDLIITDQTSYERYETLFETRERLIIDSSSKNGLGLGYGAPLKFYNAPLIWDANCTANRMYFLNTKHMKLYVLRDLHVEGPIPANNNFSKAWLFRIVLQLGITNLAAQGIIDAWTD